MLESLDALTEILVCPRTGKKLAITSEGQYATHDRSVSYGVSGSHPILVDFDSSVLIREATLETAASSVIDRKSGNRLRLALKRLVSPRQSKTESNLTLFTERVRQQNNQPRVLVVGGGSVGIGLSQLYDAPDIRLVAFDVYASPFVQFVADAHKIPLADGSLDGVIIQAVLEHVLDPQAVSCEIHRVLKSGGLVYAETPFMQQVHEAAYDFTRYTDSGHRYLFRKFEVIRSGALHGAADQLLRSIDYFARSFFRSIAIGKLAKLLFFWLKYLDALIPEKYQVDAASAVFFLGSKSDQSITPPDIIRYYQGAQSRAG